MENPSKNLSNIYCCRDSLESGKTASLDNPKLDIAQSRFGATRNLVESNSAPIQWCEANDKIIAIGASTGGTVAIKAILEALPASSPAVVISQHIPEKFSKQFASQMNAISAMTVCQAEEGQQIIRGHVYIAPGHSHLMVERNTTGFICRLDNGPPVNRHKPSVDVLFQSVARHAGRNAIGVILTGMGDDGARGMVEMKKSNLMTIAQDEASSVVWGMPGEAVKQGCVDKILPLNEISVNLKRFSG